MKGWIGALALLSLLALCHADTDAEMGGAAAEDTDGLSAIAAATVGDYGPDPNAQIITDESGGTAVVLSNQNSVHEQTDDTWKIHLVREAQRKTKEENKRKNALEEKRKQSYEEANKQDQEEEKQKDLREKNMQKRAQDNKGQGTLSPSEGPQASTTSGGAQSEPIAAPVPMKDICTFSKDAACDTNFQNRGLAGMLMRMDQYSRNPFNEGGDFNAGWKWTHPYLCCGTSDDATLSSKFILAKTCPPGSSTVGFSGALLLTQGYETNNVFAPGGDFNTGWKWTHPLLCQVNDVAKVSGGTNWCLFAAQCPGGKWTDKGFSGVIVVNEQYDKQPFHSGGAYNAQWKWAHPRLCCRMSS